MLCGSLRAKRAVFLGSGFYIICDDCLAKATQEVADVTQNIRREIIHKLELVSQSVTLPQDIFDVIYSIWDQLIDYREEAALRHC